MSNFIKYVTDLFPGKESSFTLGDDLANTKFTFLETNNTLDDYRESIAKGQATAFERPWDPARGCRGLDYVRGLVCLREVKMTDKSGGITCRKLKCQCQRLRAVLAASPSSWPKSEVCFRCKAELKEGSEAVCKRCGIGYCCSCVTWTTRDMDHTT